ncbi:hypothetical protein WCE39_13360 [Luteimonas sp. MJ174]|uniref:hypothetical protein n=1 Tax=Luteimonas sp. MJ174 TaxID=3129237 RepID=UPI0031BB2714
MSQHGDPPETRASPNDLIGVLSGVDTRLPLGLTLGRQLRLQAWSSAAAASSRT